MNVQPPGPGEPRPSSADRSGSSCDTLTKTPTGPQWVIDAGLSPGGPGADGPRRVTVLDPARLVRFAGSLGALVDEMRSLAEPLAGDRCRALVQAELDEADLLLPAELASELQALITPLTADGETERDLRIVLAQLDGWIGALIAQLSLVVPAGPQT